MFMRRTENIGSSLLLRVGGDHDQRAALLQNDTNNSDVDNNAESLRSSSCTLTFTPFPSQSHSLSGHCTLAEELSLSPNHQQLLAQIPPSIAPSHIQVAPSSTNGPQLASSSLAREVSSSRPENITFFVNTHVQGLDDQESGFVSSNLSMLSGSIHSSHKVSEATCDSPSCKNL
jgi:hypothetical protein